MASEKPFKPLEEFTEGSPGGFALIKQARENPDILVKDIQILAGEKEGLFSGHGAFLKDYDFATFKREVVEPIRFLQSRGFDKFIPKTEFVWAKDDDGKEKGFLLMKKVKGKEVEDLEEMSPEIARELDIFLSNYFKVESETLMLGGDIISPDIWDFAEGGLSLNNIIVGKTSGDKEEHVYLVDLYPTKGGKDYYKNASLEKIWDQWFSLFNNLRRKAGGKYDFLPAQAALRNYLTTLERWQKNGTRRS